MLSNFIEVRCCFAERPQQVCTDYSLSIKLEKVEVRITEAMLCNVQVLEKYNSIQADLNVLPFCSQFIPMDVIDHPKHGSIIYHPSILPRHRGASAINW